MAGGGKKDLEEEEQRMKPPDSPRREGKRRENEDYFVVEASSNLSYLLTEKDRTFPRCKSIDTQGDPTTTLCWENLNLVFPLLRRNWLPGWRSST